MRLKAGNPQDYISFPSLHNCCEAFNSCSTVSHSQIQLLSNRGGEHPSLSPSGQRAYYSPKYVLPPEKWLESSQQHLQLPTNVLGNMVFTLHFQLLSHFPAAQKGSFTLCVSPLQMALLQLQEPDCLH